MPSSVTPAVKAMLRRKNRLMHAGHTQEAGAITTCSDGYNSKSSSWLCNADTRKHTKETWAKVCEVIRAVRWTTTALLMVWLPKLLMTTMQPSPFSMDQSYITPRLKKTAPAASPFITEITVFRMLDHLWPTATGLNAVPVWFLHIWGTSICGTDHWTVQLIHHGWPVQLKNFRLILITPVLSRTLEFTYSQYIHITHMHRLPSGLRFTDQFAFRPTRSPVAAEMMMMMMTVQLKYYNNTIQ